MQVYEQAHTHTHMLTGVSVGVWTCMHEDTGMQMYRHADMYFAEYRQ